MNQIEQRFQSFITRIRPHRVAILTNSEDPNWYYNCLGIIEFLTKLWGGARCVIIPTDGKTIDEEFWAILSSYDPDIFYQYQPTGADDRARRPKDFEQLVSDKAREFAIQNDLQEEDIRDEVENALLAAHRHEWTVSEELRQEMLLRLAPFHFEKQPNQGIYNRQLSIGYLAKGDKLTYPLTAVVDVVKSGNQRAQVTQLGVTDTSNAPPKLWLAATIGCGDEEYFRELLEEGVKPVWTAVDERNTADTLIKTAVQPWRHSVDAFPFGLTTAALTSVRSAASPRFQLPTIVVVGSSLKDFCLYFNLYWQQGRALWLPPWFIPENQKCSTHLMSAIRAAQESGRFDHNEHLVLVSYSVSENDLQKLREMIALPMFGTSLEVQKITTAMVEQQVRYPLRLYTDGHLGNITTHLLLNNNLPGWFESPVPRTLKPVSPISHRWIVDITFMHHLLPRHPLLGKIAVNGPNVGDVRAGAECVSYMCPGIVVSGDHMETNMLRPSIHVPDADEIFQIILTDVNYDSKTSDKGRYESIAIEKFGGLEAVGYALASETRGLLLEKYRDKTPSQKGVFDNGVLLKDKRRYLDFLSINKIFRNEDDSRKIIDEYVEKGVLYRGFIFMCENCSDAAWYSIGEVDEKFTCKRCGLTQQYKFASWKHPYEPAWFYKLDEMVYLMLDHNGHVPLLTLNKIRISSKDSFLFRPELQLAKKNSSTPVLELDICCITDGKLCIGEAKSTDSLAGDKLSPAATAERYRDLALQIGANIVVFSTTAPSWNQVSLDAMRNAFEGHPYIKVQPWVSTHLYGND